MSFTKKRILLALLFNAFKCFFWDLLSVVLSKISDADITADKGVLISWVVYAKKSSFLFLVLRCCYKLIANLLLILIWFYMQKKYTKQVLELTKQRQTPA